MFTRYPGVETMILKVCINFSRFIKNVEITWYVGLGKMIKVDT